MSNLSFVQITNARIFPEIGTQECRGDYITIPGGQVEDPTTGEMVPAERFCGTYFPEVKSKFKYLDKDKCHYF